MVVDAVALLLLPHNMGSKCFSSRIYILTFHFDRDARGEGSQVIFDFSCIATLVRSESGVFVTRLK